MDQDDRGDPEVARRLRQLRDKVRAELPPSLADAALRQQDEGLLYGDRDLQLLPQLSQHLAELEGLYAIREQPFRSRIPLLGRIISFFRERWNRISTKWYVLPLIEQQSRFNYLAVRVLQELHHYVQRSSMDMVHRMDTLFQTNQQENAALWARLDDARSTLYEHIRDLTSALEETNARLRETDARLQEADARLQEADARLGRELDAQAGERLREVDERWRRELDARVAEIRQLLWQEAARAEARVQQVAHEQELDRRGLAFQRMRLDRLMAQWGAPGAAPAAETREQIAAERAALLDHDYYRFEDRYRREDEVREKQRAYLPYFEGRQEVLDIGCGKGEFLELLRENNIPAYGVDLNGQMVRICRDKGLRVIEDDALRHLAGLPDGSLGGIFAAHLIEHLPVQALIDLVQQAFAKLQPGAALVFETPNPLCLWALVNYFYLDMSHVKPVHPDALAFLLENCGFRDIEVRYLSPVPEGVRMTLLPDAPQSPWREMSTLLNINLERLNNLLYGFADYAIIARK